MRLGLSVMSITLDSGRLIVSQSFFVAKEAQPRPELEADLSGKLVAQLREKPLRRRILRVGVDA